MSLISATAPFARPANIKPSDVKIIPKTKNRSHYAGAKTYRTTNPNIAGQVYDINDLIGNSATHIKARVQQLQRNFPPITRAINSLEAFTVGDGIKHQARVLDSKGVRLNQNLNQKIEDAFKFWSDEADSSGKLDFYGIQALLKRQDLEAGEYLLIKRYNTAPGRFIPYSLEIHEADVLDSSMDTFDFGKQAAVTIKQGVEYNTYTGEPIAYYIQDLYGFGKPTRVPASLVIHRFKMIRPGQVRGISPFASAVMLANDLQDYSGAEIDAAKMAAKYLSFVTSPDPYQMQMGAVETDGVTGERIEEIENAIIEYLQPGENIQIATNPRPGSNFTPFVKFNLTMLSIATGCPYEILSGDYSGYTYVNLRVSRNDFAQFIKPETARITRQLNMPVYKDFMDVCALTGRLSLPGYMSNPWRYYRSEWVPPAIRSIDPLKESKAAANQIDMNLLSPQAWIKEQGRDPELTLQEIAQWNQFKEENGIVDNNISTANANNPAAVMEQK